MRHIIYMENALLNTKLSRGITQYVHIYIYIHTHTHTHIRTLNGIRTSDTANRDTTHYTLSHLMFHITPKRAGGGQRSQCGRSGVQTESLAAASFRRSHRRTAINHSGTMLQHLPYRADINFHSITRLEEEVNINQSPDFFRRGSSADCRGGSQLGSSAVRIIHTSESEIRNLSRKNGRKNQTVPVFTSPLFFT